MTDPPERPDDVPTVTVSLVTWNGRQWIGPCIESIRAQTLGSLELLVVDNGSTDGTPELVAEAIASTPDASLVRLGTNTGYAAAHDRNILAARGAFVLLLNQDVILDPRFLEEAVAAFGRSGGVASVQGRLRRLGPTGDRGRTLDTTGLAMQRDRRVISRAQGRPDGPEHEVPGPVWGADGPAPVFRRSALLGARLPRTGGGWEVLDHDFFAYKEDVDLAWRLRRLGWIAWYQPTAIAWHARGESATAVGSPFQILRARRQTSRKAKALSWRNQRLMMVKNDRRDAFVRDLPWILRREVLSLTSMVVFDPLVLVALPSLGRSLPGAMRKRRHLARLADRDPAYPSPGRLER